MCLAKPCAKQTRTIGVTDLAEKFGRSKTHISAVLRGERKPGPDLMKALNDHGVQIAPKRRRRAV